MSFIATTSRDSAMPRRLPLIMLQGHACTDPGVRRLIEQRKLRRGALLNSPLPGLTLGICGSQDGERVDDPGGLVRNPAGVRPVCDAAHPTATGTP